MMIELNYKPHAAQLAIHRARRTRFRTVCTGRRFGKTLSLAAELLHRGGRERGGDYGWVGAWKERIETFARTHRGRVILDATGVGDPIFDDLRGGAAGY